jgi:hypothetical protein
MFRMLCLMLAFCALACAGSTHESARTPAPSAAPTAQQQELWDSMPTREEVVAAMDAITPQMTGCLRHLPRGSLLVCIEFVSDGTVSGVGMALENKCQPFSGALVSDPRNACVETILRSAKLPPFRKATFRVMYPFNVGS